MTVNSGNDFGPETKAVIVKFDHKGGLVGTGGT